MFNVTIKVIRSKAKKIPQRFLITIMSPTSTLIHTLPLWKSKYVFQ